MLTELVGIINKMFLLPYQGRYLSLYCNKSKTNFMQKELAFLITFYLIKSGSGKGYAIRLVQGAGKWQLYLYINHSLTFMAVRHIFGAIIPLIQWNLYYPTLYYPNFQLSDLQSTLPTPFKPVILGFLLYDVSIIRPNCYSPKRVG